MVKLATLKSIWEALDWRETKSANLCSATNHCKSQGTEKEQKRKTVVTLGCTIQALYYVSVAMLGFLLPTD